MNTRQMELLNYLLDQDNYVPANILSKRFGVTPKTIYLDINVLRTELEQYELDIEKRPHRGILILGNTNDRLKAKKNANILKRRPDIHLFDIEDRRETIFIDLVLHGNSLSLLKTSKKYYVSKTAILNDLDILTKKNLSRFHIYFETNDKLVQTVGSEHNIQASCIDFFLSKLGKEKNLILETYFDSEIFNNVSTLFNESEIINGTHMTDYYEQALFVTMLIFLSRIKTGFHIKQDGDSLLEDIEFISEYHRANEMIEYLESKLNVTFTEGDKRLLAKYLTSYRTVKLDVDKSLYNELITEIILRLEQTDNIKIANRTELEDQLYQHIPPMILRLKNGINIINPLLDEIKSRFQPVFTISWYVLSVIEHKYHITLTEDEVSFITLYFQMAVNKSLNSRKILVVCPYGEISSKYIVRKLRLMLPKHDDIQSCSINDIKNNHIENVDLIVSTSSQHINGTSPIVRVSPFLDSIDCANIFNSYAKHIFLKNPSLNNKLQKKVSSVPTLKKYVKEENLFLNAPISSKNECLDFLINVLEIEGTVKKEFRLSVYEREKFGSTVLENNVALPHGIPASVEKISIAIMTLNKPIKWSSHYVDTIILLAIPKDRAIEFNDIVLEIYSMISNIDFITKLKKMNSREEFLRAL